MVSNIVFKLNFPANVEDFNDRRDAILFTDVLGDTFSIPWYQCQSWEIFHEILCVLFKHKAGKAYVQSRSYEIAQIISENKSLTIAPDTWSDTIDRGMKMEMSIVVRRYEEEHPSHARMITCHRCHKGMGKSRLREDEWMTCLYCSARIQADVQEESEETRNLDSASPDSNGDGANKQTSEGSRQTDGTERQGENEMTFFLRIRLMMRIQRRMDLPLEASPVASSQTFQGTVPTSRGFIETLLEKLFKAHPQSTPTRRRE
ncbi:hypothetical protein OF83DRAFT_1120404 [Amylostereum chailletii]|nr:hypothetical protein OF83DRAFT_1120404 [Amylostereum chailletii]